MSTVMTKQGTTQVSTHSTALAVLGTDLMKKKKYTDHVTGSFHYLLEAEFV